VSVLAADDVEGLRQHLFANGDPNFNQSLRVVSAGGDVYRASTAAGRELSIVAVAAQCEAVNCVRFLLASGAKVGASEVAAAFRSGNAELMRLLWDAFPAANPLELAFESIKSWNAAGLRWLLDHQISAVSLSDLVRLLKGARSSGSYSCGSLVFSASDASQLRLLRQAGRVGRALGGGLATLMGGREVSFIPDDSMAADYSEELLEWLPDATEVRLVARHEGRDAASVNAFIAAAKGLAKTLTFVETENGGSICGGYLDVAWVADGYASDPSRRSFIFTLKNHFGVPPTKFTKKRGGEAAYTSRGYRFSFAYKEGFSVCYDYENLSVGEIYEAPRQGAALFNGDDQGKFRAARWELWEVV
jgi:hypothetical protein